MSAVLRNLLTEDADANNTRFGCLYQIERDELLKLLGGTNVADNDYGPRPAVFDFHAAPEA